MEWVYILGYLWFWRYHVGMLTNAVTDNNPDVDDWVIGVFMGSFVTVFWPITVAGRMIYVIHQKYLDDVLPGGSIFPAAKQIETRTQKIQRKQREERENHEAAMRMERVRTLQARQRTNELESEAGIPLTKWEN